MRTIRRIWCDMWHSHRALIKVAPGVWECCTCGVRREHPAAQKAEIPAVWR